MVTSAEEHRAEGERIRAVAALAGRTDDEALGLLLDAARDDSWRVRERAVRQLTAFAPERLVSCVRDTVEGAREPAVRNAAMDALVRQGESALTHIFTLLTAGNWELRLHGSVMLGNIKSPLAVEPLAKLLHDEAENVVHAAAESLGAIGDPAAVQYLVLVLRTQEFWSQYPTVVALGRIAHHSAVEPLLDYLGDEMLAPPVVDALGSIADPRALTPLLQLLASDEEPPLVPHSQVLRALVRIMTVAGGEVPFPEQQRPVVRKAVEAALGSEDVEDRLAALIVAGWSADPDLVSVLVPALEREAEQEAAHQALRKVGAAAGPALVGLLESAQPSVRRSAIRLLAETGYDMHDALRHIIDPDETVRMEVAIAVGLRGSTALTEYLFEMLLDESEEVRRVALEVLASFRADANVRQQLYRRLEYYPDDHLPIIIETLGRVDIADALPRLRALVSSSHGEAVRAAVVRAVSSAGEGDAVDILLTAIADPAPSVRVEALRGLSRFRSPGVFEAVAQHLDDRDVYAAYAAVSAVGNLGDARGIPLLERIAADDARDMGVRVEAVRSLGRLQAQGSAGALVDLLSRAEPDVRREITKSLAVLGGREAFGGLIKASADAFWAVRAAAVSALAAHGAAGVEYVLKALDDPEALVRKAAVRGLSVAGPSMTLRLIPLLADDELEEVVTATLAGFGERVVPFMADAVRQPDPTLRLRLARVLGKIKKPQAQAVLDELAADPVPEVAAVAERARSDDESNA